jgi:hypothetical protein
MTYEQAEARARELSELGCKLRLEPNGDGWLYQWAIPGGMLYVSGHIGTPSKVVALVWALEAV